MTVPDSSAPGAECHVLIVDDHPIMRQGVLQVLGTESDLVVSGHAQNAAQALAALRSRPFDLVILDISLHGVSGIDLLKDIRIRFPKLLVLVFSMHDEILYAERALRAGARGYLMKHSATDCLVKAIRRIRAGNLYVSETVNGRLLTRLLDGGKMEDDPAEGGGLVVARLSNRELEVFHFIGRGRGTRGIAVEMNISVKTVETYRAHIKEKLHLKTAPELIRYAVNWVGQQGGG